MYLVLQSYCWVKDIFTLNGLTQVINKPTRITKDTKTLIDIIVTTDTTKVANQIVICNSISDHDVIGIIRKLHVNKYKPRMVALRDFSKYDVNEYKEDLRNTPWETSFIFHDFNSAWDHFKSLLLSVIDKHAPITQKKVRGKDAPWMNKDIKSKIRERDYLLKQARRTGTELVWSNYKRMRNEVTKLIRSAKANHCRDSFRNHIDNPKSFWNQLKRAFPMKNKDQSIASLKVDNNVTTDKKEIANQFCSFFTKVGLSLIKNINRLSTTTWTVFPNVSSLPLNPMDCVFKFQNVYVKDTLTTLKQIKPSKAAGIDNISGRFINDGAEKLSAPLSFLVNVSFRTGIFPSLQKVGKVTPLHKSGDKSRSDNYRPISVLNVLSKVVEKLAHLQLANYLESNNLLCPYQYGFRSHRSTQNAVTEFVDSIRINMDNGMATGAIFMDLQKAFDSVHHGCLLQKLPLYGVKCMELERITDYLFQRSQLVRIGDTTSDVLNITHGVPQGSIFGPLLFIILINDIHLALKDCKSLLHADDAVIYFADKNIHHIENILNLEANIVAQWFNDNFLV